MGNTLREGGGGCIEQSSIFRMQCTELNVQISMCRVQYVEFDMQYAMC